MRNLVIIIPWENDNVVVPVSNYTEELIRPCLLRVCKARPKDVKYLSGCLGYSFWGVRINTTDTVNVEVRFGTLLDPCPTPGTPTLPVKLPQQRQPRPKCSNCPKCGGTYNPQDCAPGVCRHCAHAPTPAVPGKTLCQECAEDDQICTECGYPLGS